MDNEKIKEALDDLSKTICKEGLDAVNKLVVGMGYVAPPPAIEDGVYVGLEASPGGRPKGRIIIVKDGEVYSSEEYAKKIIGVTRAAFDGGKMYLKLVLRPGDCVTINGQTFKG